MLTQTVVEMVTSATARALASSGPQGINVVPVSVVKVLEERIYLYNFFMHKTVENIMAEPNVSLACWVGLSGVQIKAVAEYVTTGIVFETACVEMKERFPERILSGVIVLLPREVYDISAEANKAGKKIA